MNKNSYINNRIGDILVNLNKELYIVDTTTNKVYKYNNSGNVASIFNRKINPNNHAEIDRLTEYSYVYVQFQSKICCVTIHSCFKTIFRKETRLASWNL